MMFLSIKVKKLPILLIFTAVLMIAAVYLIRRAPLARGSEDNRLKVPIIMYHSISKDESRAGEYTVTPQLFEEDIIYLKQQGYEAITVNELIMHLRYGSALPKKPVIITLDDGHLNSLTKALPIVKKHGFKMTVSCVGKWSFAAGEEAEPDENYSYLDAEDIKALRESGVAEIACHSYDMHSLDGRRGVLKAEGESDDDYQTHLLRDIFSAQRFFDESCGFKPNVFTYPYGFYTEQTADIVKSAGFDATLTCEEGINIIESEQSLYGLKRFNRPYGETSGQFFSRVLSS